MTDPRHRAVIVGCGNIAGLYEKPHGSLSYSHGRAFSDHPSFEIVGCVDSDIRKAKEFSEKYGIKCYDDDIEKIIYLAKPHVVSVCTPDSTHYEVTKRILSKISSDLKLVFLEKPACQYQRELTELVSISNQSETPIIVNMSRRYHAWYRWLKENYNRDQFGALIRVDIFYYGGWQHNGVHAVDLVHFLFGETLTNGKIVESWLGPEDSDPTYTVRCETKHKATPVWFHGFSEKHYQIFDCDFKFSNARLQISNFEEKIELQKLTVNPLGERMLVTHDSHLSRPTISPIGRAIEIIDEYLNYLKKESLVGCTLQDIERTMNLIWDIKVENNA